ncbi:hypothetical protein AYK20_04125 [Thermoplasmatales archaeon SG8-52-1]|nr:MAG: hypothetical protein AYK20_04125 [Thermoplasmatales archaeon SG8-52-1]
MKKKKITIILLGILVFSGLGVGAGNTQKSSLNQSIIFDEYDMVIIAPDEFSASIQPLIDHKNSHSVKTFLKTTEEIYSEYNGCDVAEEIKLFIRDAVEQWSIRYVMLVGGKNETPVRYSTIYLRNKTNSFYPVQMLKSSVISDSYISDLYYADIYDGDGKFCTWDSNNNGIFGEMDDNEIIDQVDLYPDVYIGRLLCYTPSEVTIVVKKIIDYETTTYGKNWFENLILCGGDTFPYTYEEVIVKLIFKIIIGVNCRVAWEGEYLCNEVEKCLKNFQTKKIYASSLLGIRYDKLTSDNINSAINDGAGFLLFATHGSTDEIVTHFPFSKKWLPSPDGYHTTEIEKLTNKDKLPVAVFCACLCGDFNSVEKPIAWAFVQHENGGAIASFACTTDGNAWPTTYTTKSLMSLIAFNVFKAYADGIDTIGEVWGEAITKYLNDEDAWRFELSAWDHYLTLEEWILFGDPSLKIGGYNQG